MLKKAQTINRSSFIIPTMLKFRKVNFNFLFMLCLILQSDSPFHDNGIACILEFLRENVPEITLSGKLSLQSYWLHWKSHPGRQDSAEPVSLTPWSGYISPWKMSIIKKTPLICSYLLFHVNDQHY